jgi:two-component system nitrate/nitrite response regulator NarL
MVCILIADDHRLTVDGMVKLLWEEWPDLLTAYTVAEAIRQVDPYAPDLLLLDLQFRHCRHSGFAVLEHCQRKQLSTRVLITSAFGDPETIRWARERKAHGFVTKSSGSAELITAIRTILDGGESWPPSPRPESSAALRLRHGHRQVLECVAQGMTHAEAAQALGLAVVTVEKYLKEARERLGAMNTAHAVLIAERRGLLLLTRLTDGGTVMPSPAATEVWRGGGGAAQLE